MSDNLLGIILIIIGIGMFLIGFDKKPFGNLKMRTLAINSIYTNIL